MYANGKWYNTATIPSTESRAGAGIEMDYATRAQHVNGALTQGENTADMGGVAIAYTAFKLTKEGQDSTKIDGLTPDQRFFLAFAQSWRKK